MLLLSLYVGALILGGGMLGASALLSGHGDHDHDADHDMEHEVGHDHDGDHEGGHIGTADALWMPILSMRFWTFFLAFFGLTGALLTGLSMLGLVSGPWWVTLALAVGLGFGSGYGVSVLIRSLKTERVNSEVIPEVDYVGKVGEVLLDVAAGDPGHVRLDVKGTSIDLPATLDAGGTPAGVGPGAARLARGKRVLVTGWEQGRLQVQAYEEPADAERGRERERA